MPIFVGSVCLGRGHTRDVSPILYGIFDFRHFSFVASIDGLRSLFCEFSFCSVGIGIVEYSEAKDCGNVLGVGTILEMGASSEVMGVTDLVTGRE